MGLDMYLMKKGRKKGYKPTSGLLTLKRNKGGQYEMIVEDHGDTELIYWRKDNHIHKWFVDNVQKGIDDCKKHVVSVKKLKDLEKIITEVLDSDLGPNGDEVIFSAKKAMELLPTQEGFFFGGTEYDEDYYQSLRRTRNELHIVINSTKKEDKIYYQSSW